MRILPIVAAAGALPLMVSGALGETIATVVSNRTEARDVHPCQFEGDRMTLIVSDGNKELSRLGVCSSYGSASAEVVIDARGKKFVLLRHGEGHGTNAVQEYLTIFGVAKDLVEY